MANAKTRKRRLADAGRSGQFIARAPGATGHRIGRRTARSSVWSELANQFASLPADQVLDKRNTARDCTGDPTQGEGPEEHDCGFDDGEQRSPEQRVLQPDHEYIMNEINAIRIL